MEPLLIAALERVPEWLRIMMTDQPPIRDMKRVEDVENIVRVCTGDPVVVLDAAIPFPGEDGSMAQQAVLRTSSISALGTALSKCTGYDGVAILSMVKLNGSLVPCNHLYVTASKEAAVRAQLAPPPAEPEVVNDEPVVAEKQPEEAIVPAVVDTTAPSPKVATRVESPPQDVTPIAPPTPAPSQHDDMPDWLNDAVIEPVVPTEATTVFVDSGGVIAFTLIGVLSPACMKHVASMKIRWPATCGGKDRLVGFSWVNNKHLLLETRVVNIASAEVVTPMQVAYRLEPVNARVTMEANRNRRNNVKSRERQRWMMRR